MPTFRELDPDQALRMMEGCENVLLPAYQEQEKLYNASCPACGGPCLKEFLSLKHALPQGALVPRSGLKCEKCGCVFDPHSGVIIKATRSDGSPAEV